MNSKILVVVVLFNSVKYINDCFTSLLLAQKKSNFDVLLIDNASSDGTVGYIRREFPNYKIIELSENKGFAAGNNIGFEYAKNNVYDYVYLLNHDTEVEPDFIEKVVNLAESDKSIGAVQSKLLLHNDRQKINSIGNNIHYLGFAYAGGYLKQDKENLPVSEIAYPSGACTLYKMSVLKKIGFFWPDFFMYHEDTDLGWRIWLSGFRCLLEPESVVYHKYEFSRSIKKFYFMEKNRYLVLLQNYKVATIILFLPAFIVMNVLMALYSFYAGWWKEYFCALGYVLNPLHWKSIYMRRKKIQSLREVPDKKIISYFTGKIEFQEVANPLLKYLVNPFFNFYWYLTKRIVMW